MDYEALARAIEGRNGKSKRGKKAFPDAPMKQMAVRTPLQADAPAPRIQEVIAERGAEPTAEALKAWHRRVNGEPIVDVAHQMGVPLALAKQLINEAHSAITEDLKANLDLNRQLDLARVDGLLNTYYPMARGGDYEAATVTLRCMGHRAKLTGIEPLPDAGRSHPENVMIWIQQQLPSINKIVDSLPLELPPSAP